MAQTSFIFNAGFWPVSLPAVIRPGDARCAAGTGVMSSFNMMASLLLPIRATRIERLRLGRASGMDQFAGRRVHLGNGRIDPLHQPYRSQR